MTGQTDSNQALRATLNRQALLVGINEYASGIAKLGTAAGDAQAVSELLARDHGYTVTCLTDAQATVEAILQGLDAAARSLGDADGFLLYFAGHGVALGDGSEGPQGYLLAADARATDEATWLPMDRLRQALERLSCRHLLVVLDCCFAGSFRWSSSRDAVLVGHPLYDSQFARYLDGEAWHALTSAAHDQRAADTLPGRRNTRGDAARDDHSPFAAALLRGLSGAADTTRARHPPDGVITATELYQYLFEELTSANASVRQTPGLWPLRPTNVGEYIFLNPAAALNTLPDPPLDDQNNPWLGLRAYTAADAGLFFGRRRVVDALIARVGDPAAASLLVVVGASGTGKSSVVKAGLLPALGAGTAGQPAWQIAEAPRLRSDPMTQLAEGLQQLQAATAGGRQLLLFDQFEELYTQCKDAALRDRFLLALRALVDRADGPLVVLTLRSDFEPRLAASPHFSALIPSSRFLVPSFSHDEMREIVEAPLRAKALYFDPPELADRLLDEVAAMPGALPMLSFALAEMYRHAQLRRRQSGSADRGLTAADYTSTGGVVGALHQRASALYAQSAPAAQRSIEHIFLRMVSQEGARLTRRRVSLAELESPAPAGQAQVNEVVAQYVAARLLVIDEQYIEPAHDTLVVAWEQLQEWLAASAHQPLLRALWRAARDWETGNRSDGLLWNNDPRLPQARAIATELNRLELAFVQASERRRLIRRRVLVGATLATMGALAFAAVFSLERAAEATRQALLAQQQTVIAQQQTARAEQQVLEAQYSEGRSLLSSAARARAEGDHFSAASAAAMAIGFRHFGVENPSDAPRLIDSMRSEYALAIAELTLANLAAPRPVAWMDLGHAAVGADGDLLAGLNGSNQIELRDFASEKISLLETPEGKLQKLAFSPDGRQLAAAFIVADDRWQVALWRPRTGWGDATLQRLDLPDAGRINTLTFDPASQRLAAATNHEVALWNLAHPAAPLLQRLVVRAEQNDSRQTSLAFSPDGKALLSGGWHNRLTRFPIPLPSGANAPAVRLRGTALGPEWRLWSEHVQKGDYVNAIAFAPDDERLIIATANQIRLATVDGDSVSFDDGAVHDADLEIQRMALSSDGRVLALTDGGLQSVALLQVPSLVRLGQTAPLNFPLDQVSSLQFFDEGRLLLVASPGQMQIVDLAGVYAGDGQLMPGALPDVLPPAGGSAGLRALIDSGQLDPLRLAFPDPDARPAGLKWQLHDDEDGLIVSFEDPAQTPDPARGDIQLSLQPGEARLVAVGISRFSIHSLRGGDRPAVELVNIADQELVFAISLVDEQWGLDQMRFSDDGERLLLKVSNFDGDIIREYAWATAQPNLLPYYLRNRCQEPINLPPSHRLMQTRLLDCPP